MRKIVKISLYVLVALLALAFTLIVGAFLVASYIDYSRYKPEAETWLGQKLGREVSINGDFDAEFSLKPSLYMSDVSVANAPWGEQDKAIKLGELSLRVNLLSFLGLGGGVEQIILKNLEISLESQSGNYNLGAARVDDPASSAGTDSDYGYDEGGDDDGGYDGAHENRGGGFAILAFIENADIANIKMSHRDHDSGLVQEFHLASLGIRSEGEGMSELHAEITDIVNGDKSTGAIEITVAGAGKNLAIDSAFAKGGRLFGDINHSRGSFVGTMELADFELAVIDILLGVRADIAGRVNGELTLQGDGDDIASMSGRLLLMSDNVRVGLPRAAVELLGDSLMASGCVLLDAPVSGGIMEFESAVAVANLGTVRARGGIDFVKERLDIPVDIRLKPAGGVIDLALSAHIWGDVGDIRLAVDESVSANIDLEKPLENALGALTLGLTSPRDISLQDCRDFAGG